MINFVIDIETYLPPDAQKVRLKLEGVIADSQCPVIGSDVRYNEYVEEDLSDTDGDQYISIF
jgi:signal recognition particle receptor subunit beta